MIYARRRRGRGIESIIAIVRCKGFEENVNEVRHRPCQHHIKRAKCERFVLHFPRQGLEVDILLFSRRYGIEIARIWLAYQAQLLQKICDACYSSGTHNADRLLAGEVLRNLEISCFKMSIERPCRFADEVPFIVNDDPRNYWWDTVCYLSAPSASFIYLAFYPGGQRLVLVITLICIGVV